MDSCNLYWLAGILEGEGSFFIRKLKGKEYPTIAVKMTDQDVVERIKQITGVGTICTQKPDKLNWKQTYKWQVAKSLDAINLMRLVLPLMGQRRKIRIKSILNQFLGV